MKNNVKLCGSRHNIARDLDRWCPIHVWRAWQLPVPILVSGLSIFST